MTHPELTGGQADLAVGDASPTWSWWSIDSLAHGGPGRPGRGLAADWLTLEPTVIDRYPRPGGPKT